MIKKIINQHLTEMAEDILELNDKHVKKFIKEQQQRDSNMEFVIHRVSPEYFSAPFVGTLAVYNKGNVPGIRIELQEVTKELVDSIDKGKRPRDWEACLILDYEFFKTSYSCNS